MQLGLVALCSGELDIMFIWNDSELKALKQRTATEPGWRRLVAIMLALVFIIVAGFIGAILGIFIVTWVQDGMVVTSLNSLMSDELSTAQVIAAVVSMAICIPLSVVAWEYTMNLTKLVCEDTIRRIKHFGPY